MENKNPLKKSHFSDFLNPSRIVFDLQAKNKIDALDELLEVLAQQKLISNKKLVLTRLIDRERLESTAIGHGVALPHARLDSGHDIQVVIGRSQEGIDFEAIDNQKVHLIILVVWNPSIPGLFNHLFAGLAKFLRKEKFRQSLFEAQNKEELYQILSEITLLFPQHEEKIINRASLLWKLQEITIALRKTNKEKKKDLQEQANMIRMELDEALVDRFDRLMARYGYAVAEVIDGVCQSCNINLATSMSSALDGRNDIFVCENCGKFLVSKIPEKK